MSVEIARDFLKALFHPCPVQNKLRIEVRCLQNHAGTIMAPQRSFFPITDFGVQHASNYCIKMRDHWDVYVGVLPRCGECGMSEAVPLAPWLYTDIDGGEEGVEGAIELAKKADLLPCHLCVKSGNGIHIYWRIVPFLSFGSHEERRMFSGYLKRLVLTIGGTAPAAHADDSCTDLARILRVPGTYNHKRELKMVKVVRYKPDLGAYPIEAWDSLLHPLPNPRPISTKIDWTFSGEVPPGIKRWAEQPFPEGKRHKDLTSAGAWLHRDLHIPIPYVEELLLTKARASYGARAITDEEVRSICKWLR